MQNTSDPQVPHTSPLRLPTVSRLDPSKITGFHESVGSDLQTEIESAIVLCRRNYLWLRSAIHNQNPLELDEYYDRFGHSLRQYLRLVSVRVYLPIQHRLKHSGEPDSDYAGYLRFAHGNMRQVAAFFRVYREPDSRRLSRFIRDLESIDRLLQEQYRRERNEVLPSLERPLTENALVA